MESQDVNRVNNNGTIGDGNKVPLFIPAKASVSAESNGNGAMSMSDSEEPSSRPVTASAGKLLDGYGDEIGEDVRMIVTLLENAGFCGPSNPMSRPSTATASRPGTAGSDVPPPARPSTAEKPYRDAFVAAMGDSTKLGKKPSATSAGESTENGSCIAYLYFFSLVKMSQL